MLENTDLRPIFAHLNGVILTVNGIDPWSIGFNDFMPGAGSGRKTLVSFNRYTSKSYGFAIKYGDRDRLLPVETFVISKQVPSK